MLGRLLKGEKKIVILNQNVLCLGIFFYNGHPVRQVDVVGIVVHTKERDAFYSYGGKISFLLCSCTYQPSNLTVKTSKVAFFLSVLVLGTTLLLSLYSASPAQISWQI